MTNTGFVTCRATSYPFRPGMPLLLDMGGEGPARPGAYSTSLRVLTAEGDALVIPVTLEISAAPAWGVLCMLAGLACVGLIPAGHLHHRGS